MSGRSTLKVSRKKKLATRKAPSASAGRMVDQKATEKRLI